LRKKGAARDHASHNTCPYRFRERTCRLMRFDLIAVQGGVDPHLGRSALGRCGCDLGVGCAFGRG
jgi:hypothetical protein